MVVRVKLRIERGGSVIDTSALANSGYEAETPQLLVPIGLAERLGLWPPRGEAYESEYETAGGPLRVWVYPRACRASVVVEDAETSAIEVDIVVSPLADEVLMSDKVVSELGIALEDVGRGYWRFRWEPKDKLRPSIPPKYWR